MRGCLCWDAALGVACALRVLLVPVGLRPAGPLCAGLFVLGRVARGGVRPPCTSGACWVTAHCAVVCGVVCVGTRRSGFVCALRVLLVPVGLRPAVPLCAGLFVLGYVARGGERPPCASGAWVGFGLDLGSGLGIRGWCLGYAE